MTAKTSVTERYMLNKLYDRYTNLGLGGANSYRARFINPHQTRYVMAEHVRNAAGWEGFRTADFIVMDTNTQMTRGLALIGHEVKCSRADWLNELRQPEKAAPFIGVMDHWWLVVSDSKFVKEGELPEQWGLMALVERNGERTLRQIKDAPRLTPIQTPGIYRPDVERRFMAPLLRAVARTAENRVRRSKGWKELSDEEEVELIHQEIEYAGEVPVDAATLMEHYAAAYAANNAAYAANNAAYAANNAAYATNNAAYATNNAAYATAAATDEAIAEETWANKWR